MSAKVRTYYGVNIDPPGITGYWSCLSPDRNGYLKADTLDGLRHCIRVTIANSGGKVRPGRNEWEVVA